MKSTLQSITAGLLLASPLLAADDFRFVKATVENTTLADGTQLKVVSQPGNDPAEITRSPEPAEPDNHWHWQEGFGSGPADSRGTFFASGKSGSDCPVLRTTVAGLKPGSVYDVYGFFWVAGYPDDKATPTGNKQWDVRFGLGLADLLSYSHRDNSGFPGTIGPGNPYREVLRNSDSPLQPAKPPLADRQDDKRLFRVRLGTEAADANGSLIVNVDDRPGDPDQAPTCYDGIGVMELTGVKARVAAGAPGSLHLAARAGDWEMARRELAAGADPNTLDKDGLTP